MKHEFIAKEDINRRSGDVLITAKVGETITLSDRAAEIAATFGELEYKGLIPETEPEKEFGSQAETADATVEELIKQNKREVLVEIAVSLGIPVNSDTKKELAEAIVKRRETLSLTDNLPVSEVTETGDEEILPDENSIDEETK